MKKIIIIFYHIFFFNNFTIYLRFNYTCNKKRVQIYLLHSPLCIYYIYSRFFLEHTSCYQYRPLHFVMPCILLKKKQNKTCIAVITRLTYVAMLSAIDPVVNLALMVFLSNGSNIRHSSVSRCPTSQISPVLCGALEDFNTAVNEHLLAVQWVPSQ